MCSQFLIMTSVKDLEKHFGIKIPIANPTWKAHIAPHVNAPVITRDGLRVMKYALIPAWAKEARLKFSTHNARIETIESKAVWKKPFIHNHCLVPLTSFIEPIYRGEYAGNMVLFNGEAPLVAAGIFDRWQDPKTGETVESFAIITKEPCTFIKKSGHDRQPAFLDPKKAHLWVEIDEKDPQKLKELLAEISIDPTVNVEVQRKLKEGWEKRVKE